MDSTVELPVRFPAKDIGSWRFTPVAIDGSLASEWYSTGESEYPCGASPPWVTKTMVLFAWSQHSGTNSGDCFVS